MLKASIFFVANILVAGTLSAQGHQGPKPMPPPMGGGSSFQMQQQINQLNQYVQGMEVRLQQLEQTVQSIGKGTSGTGSGNPPMGYRLTLCSIGNAASYKNNCYGPEYKYTMNFLIVKSKYEYDYNLQQCRDLVLKGFNRNLEEISTIGVFGTTYDIDEKYSGNYTFESEINGKVTELCVLITNTVKSRIESNNKPEAIWEALTHK